MVPGSPCRAGPVDAATATATAVYDPTQAPAAGQHRRAAGRPPMTRAASDPHDPVNHRAVLVIALPIMLSNVSTPLLGAVDTAVVGQIPDPSYIGAVAVGALVFTFLFWAFGFLRIGTTGLTAQALGAQKPDEIVAALGRALLVVNGDIMMRSLALIFVFVWFMAQGAAQGDVRLAANAVLMQFISLSAYFLDGLAFAAEALVGRAVGAMRRGALSAAARLTSIWAGAVAAVVSLLLLVSGPTLIDLLSVDAAVRAAARLYLPWAVGAPLLGVWAFQLDGIFIGATRTADMRNAMLTSTAIFLLAWWLLLPLGNHGLWAALYVNYIARTITLLRYYPALLRSVPA